MADLSQLEWRTKLQKDNSAVVLDVRSDHEVAEGRIAQALQLDIYKGQEFINELQELDKSKNYFVYCRSGGRSAQACAIMAQLGFSRTYNLLGGILEWKGEIISN